MKGYTAIFIASLCLFAHATTVFEQPEFIQLQTDPFGNLLTSLVQVNMASSDSGRLNAIDDLLRSVATSLNEQLESNENAISQQRGWCTNQINELQNRINNAQTDLDNDNKENTELGNEKVSEQAALDHENGDLKTNTESKATAEQGLVDESVRNEKAVREYAEAIAACRESLRLLATLSTGQVTVAFIQIQASTKSQFANVVSLLQRHLNKSTPLIEPVITVLSELASQSASVDQAKLGNVVNLIEQLLNELSAQEANNVVRNRTTVEDLNGQVSNLETLITQNNDAIQRHTDRLGAIDKRQQELGDLISALNTLLPNLRGTLDSTNSQCSDYESNYQSVKGKLNGDVATLDRVREYFQQHVVPAVQRVDDDVYQDNLTNSN